MPPPPVSRLDLLVYLSTTLNTGHAHAIGEETIILPVLARDEEPQATTQESMFNFVRLSDGGPRRHAGPKSEVEVVSRLAADVLGSDGPIDWQALSEHRVIRHAISEVVPGFEKLAEIDETKREFQIGGRTFHEPRFATADGKARFHVMNCRPSLADDQLRLMTVRSEGQFNTVVYEEEDLYRGQSRRDVVLVHPDDIRRLRLAAGSRVTVRSESGQMDNILLCAFAEIPSGQCADVFPRSKRPGAPCGRPAVAHAGFQGNRRDNCNLDGFAGRVDVRTRRADDARGTRRLRTSVNVATYSAVVGSMIARTAEILFAGKPACSACRLTSSALSAT